MFTTENTENAEPREDFLIVPTLCAGISSGRSASISDRRAVKIRSHAERRSDKELLIVPALCVGTSLGRSASINDRRA
ncbi:MAG: hypothetical protein R6X11_10315 [Desulfonatronovibrio sp.]